MPSVTLQATKVELRRDPAITAELKNRKFLRFIKSFHKATVEQYQMQVLSL